MRHDSQWYTVLILNQQITLGSLVKRHQKSSHLRFAPNVVLYQATWEGGGSHEGRKEGAGDVDSAIGNELLLTNNNNNNNNNEEF